VTGPPTRSVLADRLAAVLVAARDPEQAAAMEAYLRHQFRFLGIPAPARAALVRQVLAEHGRPGGPEVLAAAEALWTRDEREHQLVGSNLLRRFVRSLPPGALDRVGRLITTRSWWDTVDELAIHVVGGLVRAEPALAATMDRWVRSEDRWLARAAILHQHRWKAATDEGRLFRYCLLRAADTDFFVRKAIGWALREHSKTDGAAVRQFVETHGHELSGLTRREALRWMERHPDDA
jgi:3-methyladenine DNA glycosylase AlkD